MIKRQKEGSPVHQWSLAQIDEAGGWKPSYMRVEQFMTTNLVTVTAEDTLELVANLMDWEKIRHIPVEDAEHHLVGLISYRSVFRYFAEHLSRPTAAPIPVISVMVEDPITVSPETSTLDAIETMRSRQIGCLPVVKDGKLVGILTERDFMAIARELIERKLRE
jgi:CBS domain-containing protein